MGSHCIGSLIAGFKVTEIEDTKKLHNAYTLNRQVESTNKAVNDSATSTFSVSERW